MIATKKRAVSRANGSTAQEYIVKNRLQSEDEAVHGWYRFVLGYPPHLVSEYLEKLSADPDRDWVFDPFCGTATTPVEARLRGFATISTDANPIALLAARVKLAWDIDLNQVRSRLEDVLDLATRCMQRAHLNTTFEAGAQLKLLETRQVNYMVGDTSPAHEFNADDLLSPDTAALIPRGFISPKPLTRVLAIRYAIEQRVAENDARNFFMLALANTIVSTAGNVGFGPEVYALPPREDADVLGAFAATVTRMITDLETILEKQPRPFPPVQIFKDDARVLVSLTDCHPIGTVITSPPYPNEKDYTRSTRLESVLLGLVSTKPDLRALKTGLLRSNTRNVFVADDDDQFVADIPSIVRVANEIENKRVKLGKTSGFERLYHRVARLYFGGMYRHFTNLLPRLRPGARCAYVVGDQMSFFRVHIRTAQLLADAAIKAGYHVEGIDLWRTRRSTATGVDLEENVLILKRSE